ncbi:MAG: hypothetical protein JAY99_01140 [Candidatus Thiodiazotropha lotti]|uniref:hypothetical protein n=1 Tax=Candidatus Thiodiazotropha endoloripes TaxID=1818881 RepID=UPI00083E2F78|nr:hypothetical protein [Candidatus Thiodiazotropha endoloripes]MCG7899909.1 hypothetical protein [Candidatus Thiodiazotropha weberae]MCG7993377.1 hypothetical protein [Candidatus Thiodiazotropha lotti]MCG7901047.1 hypothetical protein [Candidatus Thiodiazotropha weberae]MCG7913354.1 hypothetical protein [Candidatus Thiodiazotropha weberae]MCG7998105.1 hypothetical protein [Candidatus Thiodiazotropha lotti]
MKALISAAIELCLLRRSPQDLPASSVLLWITAILNLLAGVLMLMDADSSPAKAIGQTLFELALMMSALYAALLLNGRLERFIQSATALMMCGFLLGMLALPLIAWGKQNQSAEAGILFLVVFAWGVVVIGHILRHTFEFSLNVGIAIALLYTLLAGTLVALIFPVTG